MLDSTNNFFEKFTNFIKLPAYFDDMWDREENYDEALNIIDNESKINNLSRDALFYLLTLFHSGGVERHRDDIALELDKFKELILKISEITKNKSENAYTQTRELLNSKEASISGAGRNVVSEIFHTYDSIRFPVLNKNFEEELLDFGFLDKAFEGGLGDKYYKCILLTEQIRKEFNIESCMVLDCYFNYAYWERKKNLEQEDYEKWIQSKRRKKRKYLNVSDQIMKIFEIEFLPVQFFSKNFLESLQKALASYEKRLIISFSDLLKAYKVLIIEKDNEDIKKHRQALLNYVAKNTIIKSNKLTREQLNEYEKFIIIFFYDIKNIYLGSELKLRKTITK